MFARAGILSRPTSAPAFTGILDTYTGAAVAYSAARRLSSSYTGALIRVRRSSDNTEQDIGYTSGNVLDESALTSFVGANNGFVTTWYDQSGNANNLTQSTASNQPKIVASGTIKKIGSNPTIEFLGNLSTSTNYFDLTSGINIATGSKLTTVHIEKKLSIGNCRGTWMTRSNAEYPFTAIHYWTNEVYMTSKFHATQSDIIYKPSAVTVAHNIVSGLSLDSSAASSIRVNGTNIGATSSAANNNSTNTFTALNKRNTEYSDTQTQEFIMWISDKSSDIAAIESNLNTYYSAY